MYDAPQLKLVDNQSCSSQFAMIHIFDKFLLIKVSNFSASFLVELNQQQ